MSDLFTTLRTPTADEVRPLADAGGWDVDLDVDLVRLSVAVYEAPHLVLVPSWRGMGFRRQVGRVGWIRADGFGTEAEASPVTVGEPDGPWEVYVAGDDSEVETVGGSDAARWWFAVVIALDVLGAAVPS